MKKKVRIDWKTGLDITPEVFVNSDNYHIAERNLLGRFLAFRSYGILPNSQFYIEKNIDDNRLYIIELECIAMTHNGCLINIQRDTPFKKEVRLNEAGTEFYVVLRVHPYLPDNVDELSEYVEYEFALKEIDETIENEIPVLKIIKNYQHWEIDENYIPPAVALNVVDSLRYKFVEIKDIVNKIIAKLPENDALYLQCMMLQVELNNYTTQESPQEFVLLLKKFCWIFQSYLKTAKNMEYLPVIQTFIKEEYNHNEIAKMLRLGWESLEDVNQKIEEKPVEEEQEEEIFEIKV